MPSMREAIRGDGFDLGDQVEVCSQLGKNRPFVATISEMHWHAHSRLIHYRLRRRNMTLCAYTAEDFRAVVHHGQPPGRSTPSVQTAS